MYAQLHFLHEMLDKYPSPRVFGVFKSLTEANGCTRKQLEIFSGYILSLPQEDRPRRGDAVELDPRMKFENSIHYWTGTELIEPECGKCSFHPPSEFAVFGREPQFTPDYWREICRSSYVFPIDKNALRGMIIDEKSIIRSSKVLVFKFTLIYSGEASLAGRVWNGLGVVDPNLEAVEEDQTIPRDFDLERIRTAPSEATYRLGRYGCETSLEIVDPEIDLDIGKPDFFVRFNVEL
jgi:hypothetical protein